MAMHLLQLAPVGALCATILASPLAGIHAGPHNDVRAHMMRKACEQQQKATKAKV